MSKLRVVFVGLDNPHASGWRATIPIHAEMEPVAVVAAKPEETQSLQGEYKSLPVHYSVAELIDKTEFDAAVVTRSNADAPAACIELANAGKHILAEKTTARSAAEFQTIADAVAANGVQWTTGYTWRFSPEAQDIRGMVQQGAFGDVWAWEARYWTSTVKSRNPQHYLFSKEVSGGGMFSWLGCHSMDLMLYLVGQPVASVTAKVGNVAGEAIDVEDGGVAIFRFANGAIGSLRAGYFLADGGNQLDYGLLGSQGWAQWSPMDATVRYCSLADDLKAAPHRTVNYERAKVPGYSNQMGQDLLSDWLHAIRTNGTTLNNTQTALAIHKLLDAIYESSASGKEVALAG